MLFRLLPLMALACLVSIASAKTPRDLAHQDKIKLSRHRTKTLLHPVGPPRVSPALAEHVRQVAGRIVHDLNNKLCPMMSYLELAQLHATPQQAKQIAATRGRMMQRERAPPLRSPSPW